MFILSICFHASNINRVPPLSFQHRPAARALPAPLPAASGAAQVDPRFVPPELIQCPRPHAHSGEQLRRELLHLVDGSQPSNPAAPHRSLQLETAAGLDLSSASLRVTRHGQSTNPYEQFLEVRGNLRVHLGRGVHCYVPLHELRVAPNPSCLHPRSLAEVFEGLREGLMNKQLTRSLDDNQKVFCALQSDLLQKLAAHAKSCEDLWRSQIAAADQRVLTAAVRRASHPPSASAAAPPSGQQVSPPVPAPRQPPPPPAFSSRPAITVPTYAAHHRSAC